MPGFSGHSDAGLIQDCTVSYMSCFTMLSVGFCLLRLYLCPVILPELLKHRLARRTCATENVGGLLGEDRTVHISPICPHLPSQPPRPPATPGLLAGSSELCILGLTTWSGCPSAFLLWFADLSLPSVLIYRSPYKLPLMALAKPLIPHLLHL